MIMNILHYLGQFREDDIKCLYIECLRVHFAKQTINNAKYTDFIGANQKLISGTVQAY